MKKTAAQFIAETKKALDESYAGALGSAGTAIGGLGGLIAGGIGGLIGGSFLGGMLGAGIGSIADAIINHDNAKEFLKISEEVISKLQNMIDKYDLHASVSEYSNNDPGDRRYGIIIHQVNVPTGSYYSMYRDYAKTPSLRFFTKMDDTAMRAVKSVFVKQNIYYEASYEYVDPTGDHGIVTDSIWSKDLDTVVEWCDEFLSRRADLFKEVPVKTLTPAYSYELS
jgi:hypothetical protein